MNKDFFSGGDFKRDRWGRPLIAQEDPTIELPYTRATTMAGTLEDLNGLISWKQAITAIGMTRSKSTLASMSFLSWEEDKSKVKQLVDKAFKLGGGEDKADIGTAFHSLVEMWHGGTDPKPGVELPDGFGETLEAYKQFVTDHGISVEGSEVKIVNDEHHVAGTADLIYTFANSVETPFGVIPAGRGVIADLKTGSVSELSGLKMAGQLAAYSHGKPYDHEKGKRLPWPVHMESWVGLILKVDLETHTVTPWWLDLKNAYESIVPISVQVRELRKHARKMISQAEIGVPKSSGGPVPEGEAVVTAKEEEAVLPEPQAPVELETVNIEDVAPAPEKPAVEPYSLDDAKAKLESVQNLGQLRELWKDFEKARKRGQSTVEAVQLIAAKSADLQ